MPRVYNPRSNFYNPEPGIGIDYIPEDRSVALQLIDRAGQERTKKYENTQLALAEAIAKFGETKMTEGNREAMQKYLSDWSEGLYGNIKEQYGGDYAAAAPAIIREIAKERPIYATEQQGYEELEKIKPLYTQLQAEGKLVQKPIYDGEGNITGYTDPFSQQTFDPTTRKFSARDTEFWKRGDYSDYINKNFSQSLQNTVRDMGLSPTAQGYWRKYGSIKGYADKELDGMLYDPKNENYLNKEKIAGFLKENAVFLPDVLKKKSTDLSQMTDKDWETARKYVGETIKNQVTDQVENHYVQDSIAYQRDKEKAAASEQSYNDILGPGFDDKVSQSQGLNVPDDPEFDDKGNIKATERWYDNKWVRGAATSVLFPIAGVYSGVAGVLTAKNTKISSDTNFTEEDLSKKTIIDDLRSKNNKLSKASDKQIWEEYKTNVKDLSKSFTTAKPINDLNIARSVNNNILSNLDNLEWHMLDNNDMTKDLGGNNGLLEEIDMNANQLKDWISENKDGMFYNKDLAMWQISVPTNYKPGINGRKPEYTEFTTVLTPGDKVMTAWANDKKKLREAFILNQGKQVISENPVAVQLDQEIYQKYLQMGIQPQGNFTRAYVKYEGNSNGINKEGSGVYSLIDEATGQIIKSGLTNNYINDLYENTDKMRWDKVYRKSDPISGGIK